MKSSLCTALLIASLFLVASNLPMGTAQQKPPQERGRGAFSGLVEAVRKTQGCLGVETASTPDGKNLIFAWWKDREALLDWYYSDAHQQAMLEFVESDDEVHDPLVHVDEETSPILTIASITPRRGKQLDSFNLPISQIAIELYTPLPGGLAVGGSFAPKSVLVPHMKRRSFPGAQPAKDSDG